MIEQRDVEVGDGRTVRAYDTGAASGDLVLMWHHGSPQTGAPLEPVVQAADERGIRLLSYARPSYGGSTASVGRDVASAASHAAAVADVFGVDRFAVMGASGGAPHALACAALLPERVTGAVCLAGIAPLENDFNWAEGMQSDAALVAAAQGRQARAEFAETDEFDPGSFVAADYAALEGEWAALGEDVGRSEQYGPDGLIDDDVAFAAPWGFDLAQVTTPVLLVQGGLDRVIPPQHAERLRRGIPHAVLWLRPNDGHVSVLGAVPETLDWVRAL